MRKGQALIFIFFLLLITGILTGALAVMWQAEIQSRSQGKDGCIAFYLAQSGIERAKVEARNGAITAPGWSPAQNLTDGWYSYYIQDIGGGQRLLRSIGQRVVSGQVVSERQIEVTIQGMDTPLDPSDDSQVSWSWREI